MLKILIIILLFIWKKNLFSFQEYCKIVSKKNKIYVVKDSNFCFFLI